MVKSSLYVKELKREFRTTKVIRMPLLNLPIIQRIRQRLGVRARLFYLQAVTTLMPTPTLTSEEKEAMESYKEGVAKFLGVPPEAISNEVAAKWLKRYGAALISPEYLKEHPEVAKKLGITT